MTWLSRGDWDAKPRRRVPHELFLLCVILEQLYGIERKNEERNEANGADHVRVVHHVCVALGGGVKLHDEADAILLLEDRPDVRTQTVPDSCSQLHRRAVVLGCGAGEVARQLANVLQHGDVVRPAVMIELADAELRASHEAAPCREHTSDAHHATSGMTQGQRRVHHVRRSQACESRQDFACEVQAQVVDLACLREPGRSARKPGSAKVCVGLRLVSNLSTSKPLT
mmetsp:Transcript_8294/g.31205  ORF Transcript_8294/g.31205 Transcript_8294/m.31205 type:complete len:227 (-) Transcript_8294:152-832(-)